MKDSELRGIKLNSKEWITLTLSTALALGSFKPDDPWVAIPMLFFSGAIFVVLCVKHRGSRVWRGAAAMALLSCLVFIGWRDLRHSAPAPTAFQGPPPKNPSTSINQQATDSSCSNQSAGENINNNCSTTEKDRAKPKLGHQH